MSADPQPIRPIAEPASTAEPGSTAESELHETLGSWHSGQASAASLPSKTLGGYLIESEIARGGMGVVYRAKQLSADRVVALKIILSHDPDPKQQARFQAEARTAAKLDHPHIVPVYEVGIVEGKPFFSMKLIEGESLDQRLRNQPLASKEAATIVSLVARASHYAHLKGIIHRDIKPGNILLNSAGEPQITDFGLAKNVDVPSELTIEGQIVGTPSYMPPEQALGQGDLIDARSDVYSIGAVLYFCLTGIPPFQAATTAATIMQLLRKEPVSPGTLNSDIDRDLETICIKCLDKDPQRRYQSADELAEDLDRYVSDQPILARPVSRVERVRKWTKRNPVVSGLIFACAMALLTLIVGGAAYQSRLTSALTTARSESERAKSSETKRTAVMYDALVKQGEFLGETKPVGYGPEVWQLIEQANSLDTPERDPLKLRQLAINAMGRSSFEQPVLLNGLGPDESMAVIVEVTPDQRHLVVGLKSGEIAFFSIEDNREIARFHPHDQSVVGIRFPDKHTCYTYTPLCRQIRKWTFDNGEWTDSGQLNTEKPGEVTDICLSGDGRWIVGWTDVDVPEQAKVHYLRNRPNIKPFDVKSFFAIRPVENSGGQSHITTVQASDVFDIHDRYLVSIKDDSVLTVYDVAQSKVIRLMEGGGECAVSPKGDYLAFGSYGGISILDIQTGKITDQLKEKVTWIQEISSDGKSLVCSDRANQYVYSVFDREIELKTGRHSYISFSGDYRISQRLEENQVYLAPASSKECQSWAIGSLGFSDILFSPDSSMVISAGEDSGVSIWDRNSGRMIANIDAHRAAIHPSGKFLVVAHHDKFTIWKLPEIKQIESTALREDHHRIRFNAHGDQLVATGWGARSHRLFRFDVGTNGESAAIRETEHDQESLNSSAWSPSGDTLAWLRMNDQQTVTLKTFTSESGKSTEFEVDGRSSFCSLAALIDDAVCIHSGNLLLHRWDVQTRSLKKSTKKAYGPLVASPDGRFVLARRTVFSMETMEPLFTFPSLGGECWCVDWSLDGRYVAVGSRGGKAAIWDLVAMDRRLERLGLPLLGSDDASESGDTSPQYLISKPAPLAVCSPLEKFRRRIVVPGQSTNFPVTLQEDIKQKSLMLYDEYFNELQKLGQRSRHSPNYLAHQLINTAQRVERLTEKKQRHVVLSWQGYLADPDDRYTETQRLALLTNIISSYEALDEPAIMSKGLAVLAYLEYGKYLMHSQPDSLTESLGCYAAAYSLVESLSESGEFTKTAFSDRWFWLLHAYANAEARADHRARAIELINEAIQFSRKSGYDPGIGFRKEAQVKLKRWSNPKLPMNAAGPAPIEPRLPADVDWLTNWQFFGMDGAEGGGEVVGDELHLTTTVAGTEEYQVQAVQPIIVFEENAEYTVLFDAKSGEARSVVVQAAIGRDPWTHIGLNKRFDTTTEFQTYRIQFRASGTIDDCRLLFHFGKKVGKVVVKNISLEKVEAVEDADQDAQ